MDISRKYEKKKFESLKERENFFFLDFFRAKNCCCMEEREIVHNTFRRSSFTNYLEKYELFQVGIELSEILVY